jgi:hypothetical protein
MGLDGVSKDDMIMIGDKPCAAYEWLCTMLKVVRWQSVFDLTHDLKRGD